MLERPLFFVLCCVLFTSASASKYDDLSCDRIWFCFSSHQLAHDMNLLAVRDIKARSVVSAYGREYRFTSENVQEIKKTWS